MAESLFDRILTPKRLRPSEIKNRDALDEFLSDKSRIIYSSSFRRLQQKAQVFSLEIDSSVRSRLTHSLEVADIGRILATKIGRSLQKEGVITAEQGVEIAAVVENACLMHDIGNPPFGHLGEAAIIKWAHEHLRIIAEKAQIDFAGLGILTRDFFEFDGNPQGIRIVSRLHCEKDKYGLNLSLPSLLCGVKYARAAGEEAPQGVAIKKKAGYFQSELPVVEKAYQEMSRSKGCRFPLTYIMEAADDISYCLSDISDGIAKGIITPAQFLEEFRKLWAETYGKEEIPVKSLAQSRVEDFGVDVCIDVSHKAVEAAAAEYVRRYKEFCDGDAGELITEDLPLGKVLKVIKKFSGKRIYSSVEAESIELSGFAVLSGLLTNYFGKLLELPYDDFAKMVNGDRLKGREYEQRLFNRLSERCLRSYKFQLEEWLANDKAVALYGAKNLEWWLRVHLIIDHISGMTDNYALSEYQILEGIKINQKG